MPYIKGEERDEFNYHIEGLKRRIKTKGDLNYVISELVGQLILKDGPSYTVTSNWIDGVHGAERELTRRLLNPYEDIKIEENGDVPSFLEVLKTYEK
jgi:hypothetical protein